MNKLIRYFIDRFRLYRHADAIYDSALTAQQTASNVSERHHALTVAAINVVDAWSKPRSWPVLQGEIRKLAAVIERDRIAGGKSA